MIISSERKFNKCSKCGGTGEVEIPGPFPWSAPENVQCPKCLGNKKEEKKDYDYDKNIINISNIVTVGEIEFDSNIHGFDCEINHPVVRFYLNGHIKNEIMGEAKNDYFRDQKKEYNYDK